MEHWIIDPSVLAKMGVPQDLITAIGHAETYGQGFATVEFVASALIDLALHRAPAIDADPAAFTEAELKRLGTPEAIGMRHRLPYFTHIFDGGYASAYYSYLWSEVLDMDAFEAFAEAGDIFDPETAHRFRTEILGQGDKRDPMHSFIAFRGRAPDETPLLKSRGLLEEETA
jgi:peptidyl-dipeptidase Dcp